jgi:hypothetical protein
MNIRKKIFTFLEQSGYSKAIRKANRQRRYSLAEALSKEKF